MICSICPHQCQALRSEEQGWGRCGMPWNPVVARAAPHYWEEPPISGERGSGTIFFSGCSLHCVFCQNQEISHTGWGKTISLHRLREIGWELVAQGVHNLQFVNPSHYAHVVRQVLEESWPVPVIWNSSGYDRQETLQGLEGKISIYLPDLKYHREDLAQRYSGVSNYVQVAHRAIQEMYRQTGPCIWGEDGMLQRGVVIRHLMLPGQLAQAKEVMDWVARTFPPGQVLFSLMSQYTPWGELENWPELRRKLRKGEASRGIDYMRQLGLAGFYQETASAQMQYTPTFDLTGV